MNRSFRRFAAGLLWGGLLYGAGVTVRFDPGLPEVGPFPTDALAVSDPAQKTGLRVNLPSPDCQAEPSTCNEVRLINELDGFNLNPRIRVRFSGAIDTATLREGIFFVWLDDPTGEVLGAHPAGHITPINQVLYDPETNIAYAKPDEILFQHRRYALVVTDAIRDSAGDPVAADALFRTCVNQREGYCGQLGRVVAQVSRQFAPRNIVAASVFTTLSATAWLEKARDRLEYSPIGLEMARPKSVFRISELASITRRHQTRSDPPTFTSASEMLYLLNGVGRIAFGSFISPSFLNEQRIIPAVPTGGEVALPSRSERIQFHAYLPDSPAPPGGYPVVIAPGNAGNSRFFHSTSYASKFALYGMATIAIDAVGRGFGPDGRVVVQEKNGNTVELPLGGRAVDLNGDKTFAEGEGATMTAIQPYPVYDRDCFRQTALDLLQLVRAIKAGIDLDGDRIVDLDRNRIYFHGMSWGAMYGPVFVAVSPDVAAAAFEGGGGSRMDTYRWNLTAGTMGNRRPSLLNKGASFDDDYVLRYQPVKIIGVPGAVAIQEAFERLEWLQMPGDPLAYAPHLKSSTLAGVPIKRVLFQYAKGDTAVPNPSSTALARAANMRETTSYYRHDLALKLFPELNPAAHYYSIPVLPLPTHPQVQYIIAMLAHEEPAGFFASHGTIIPNVNVWSRFWFGVNLFERPEFLTEDLNR